MNDGPMGADTKNVNTRRTSGDQQPSARRSQLSSVPSACSREDCLLFCSRCACASQGMSNPLALEQFRVDKPVGIAISTNLVLADLHQ